MTKSDSLVNKGPAKNYFCALFLGDLFHSGQTINSEISRGRLHKLNSRLFIKLGTPEVTTGVPR